MGRLQTRGAAALRTPWRWVVAAVVVVGLVAGGLAIAHRSTRPAPTSAPAPSTRAVALGDSVPYGHGLHNPYLTPQLGLPTGWVSQGPSPDAYPSAVARAFGLTMSVRTANCQLTGDQLSISGAVADAADNPARDGQCPVPPQQARNLGDELGAADLARHPARLVLLQDGADDINFASCLEDALAQAFGTSLGLGTLCVEHGSLTPALVAKLRNVRTSLAEAIESAAPHAGRVAVLDYYQPIPEPSQIAKGTSASDLRTNLVCTGLHANAASTFADAQVVLSALNRAIAGAVADARAHRVTNVTLIDLSNTMSGHGICTHAPWIFSGEPVPDTTLTRNAGDIAAAKVCTGTDDLHGTSVCSSLVTRAEAAEQDLERYVWRAAHPTAAGQRAIATTVERRLRPYL